MGLGLFQCDFSKHTVAQRCPSIQSYHLDGSSRPDDLSVLHSPDEAIEHIVARLGKGEQKNQESKRCPVAEPRQPAERREECQVTTNHGALTLSVLARKDSDPRAPRCNIMSLISRTRPGARKSLQATDGFRRFSLRTNTNCELQPEPPEPAEGVL